MANIFSLLTEAWILQGNTAQCFARALEKGRDTHSHCPTPSPLSGQPLTELPSLGVLQVKHQQIIHDSHRFWAQLDVWVADGEKEPGLWHHDERRGHWQHCNPLLAREGSLQFPVFMDVELLNCKNTSSFHYCTFLVFFKIMNSSVIHAFPPQHSGFSLSVGFVWMHQGTSCYCIHTAVGWVWLSTLSQGVLARKHALCAEDMPWHYTTHLTRAGLQLIHYNILFTSTSVAVYFTIKACCLLSVGIECIHLTQNNSFAFPKAVEQNTTENFCLISIAILIEI